MGASAGRDADTLEREVQYTQRELGARCVKRLTGIERIPDGGGRRVDLGRRGGHCRRERSDGGTAGFDKRPNANDILVLAQASRSRAVGRRTGRKSLVRNQLQPESGTIFPLSADSHRGRQLLEAVLT